MNYILGAGLVGLIARDILGPDWKIIPYGKSTFYSFYPPFVDNYIISNSEISDYVGKHALIPIYTKNAYSLSGELTYNHNICIDKWLYKVYGLQTPPHAAGYYKHVGDYFAFGDCIEINKKLQQQYIREILESKETIGTSVTKIADKIITTDLGKTFEYNKIISTIPLTVLLNTMGIRCDLPSRDLWCYHVDTEKLDFEKNTHIRIVDNHIEFFKSTQVSKTIFIFSSTSQIVQPAKYLMSLIPGKFELKAEVELKNAIPCGPIPNISEVAEADIMCVGSLACHDDCQDIGSSILKLVKSCQG